jgi:hypothetical protein
MAQLAKFHEKAIAIYGCAQVSEGVSVIQATPAGTISTTSAAVTGVGTSFLTTIPVGAYLYTSTDLIIGRVLSVASATALTLEAAPALVTAVQGVTMGASAAVSGVAFKVGLGPKNAMAVLNLNYSTELTSEAFQYVGDELNRDEITAITDKYAKMDFEAFLPVLGTTTATPLVSEIPMIDWFRSSGMAVTIAAGQYTVSNGTASNAYMTVEVRRSSPDLTTQKTFTITNARGTFDLDLNIGTKPKMKFNYMGNLDSITQKLYVVSDFQAQKSTISSAVKSTTIGLAELDIYTTAVEPVIAGVTNVCFNKLTSPNVTGFEYNRYLTGCLDGWSKGAVPTDITLTVLEDSALATYNPDDNIEKNHKLTLRYSDSVAGTATKKIEITYHKIQLAKVTNSKVANYTGQDLGFRNVGYTDIKFY